ncbi:MAG: HAMP domain-containing sensor histidine kinase, partial [Chloroherpetonaceae bacterium]|nr:HAMP domain-containing sensor histidine kinase [Chloroherpetonaceae bacterium]
MRSTYIKGFLLLFLVLGAVTVFYFTQIVIEKIKDKQKREVGLWVKSIKLITETENTEELSFVFGEIVSNIDFPVILTDSEGAPLTWRNVHLDSSLSEERRTVILRSTVADMDSRYEPIEVKLGEGFTQYVHYGDSSLVVALRIAPFAAGAAIIFFILLAYFGFMYLKKSETSNIWVGLAKETAHQLGTPISSLMGWVELLKESVENPERQTQILFQMQADIHRLNRVATRFSKIGSKGTLTAEDLLSLTESVFEYFRHRIPQMRKNIQLIAEEPGESDSPKALFNRELMEWVLENLVKNAIDAIDQKEGSITAKLSYDTHFVFLDITDTGKGIEAKNRRYIFRPGFSTK